MYDLIISLSTLFVNVVVDLDFLSCTNLFDFELEETIEAELAALEETTEAELAALGEIIETAEDAAAVVDDDNFFQIETKVGFGGGFPHLARMAENPDMGSETK